LARDLEDKRHRLIARSRLGAPSTPRLLKLTVPCHLLMGDHKDIPFAFLIVGVADPQVFADARKQGKFLPYSAHNPNYVVDLAAIPVGAKAASVTVLELLAKV
jgi:hypothetical protein